MTTILFIVQDQPAVEVYRRQTKDIWLVQTYGPDEQIMLEAIGGHSVTIPVAEIYRNITFTPQ